VVGADDMQYRNLVLADRPRRGVLIALVFALVTGAVLTWFGAGASSGTSAVDLPTFTAQGEEAAPPLVQSRATLLPADCAGVLTGPVDAAGLLAQPTGSVAVHTMLGVPSTSVGLLERMSCGYQRSGPTGGSGAPMLQLGLSAFSDSSAAGEQRLRNVAAERGDTRAAVPVALGEAAAVLLTEPTRTVLMAAYDRYTVTASLNHGVFPAAEEGPVLVDLTRRVLPNLAPAAAPAPAPGTRAMN
jgi:hypothetical protein